MEGFIKIHRGLMKWEWFDDSKTLHVFLTILLNANHKDGRWQGHEVKRGQWITGRKALSKMTNISERSIRTILQRLIETGELTIKTTNRFSIITVVKWDSYQLQDDVNDQPDANKRPATDQLPTTNKNVKKVKNEKKEPLLAFGSHVKLTQKQHDKIKADMNGSHQHYIDTVNDYCAASGKSYKDYAAAIRNFYRRDKKKFNKDDGENKPRGTKLS